MLSIKTCHLYNNIRCHWITHENWQHSEYKSEINHEQEKKIWDFLNLTSSCWVEKTQQPFTCTPLGHTFFFSFPFFFFWAFEERKISWKYLFRPYILTYSYFRPYFLILPHLVPIIKKRSCFGLYSHLIKGNCLRGRWETLLAQ